MKNKLWQRLTSVFFGLLGLHLIWLLASLLVNKPLLPSPFVVYQGLSGLIQEEIFWHLVASLRRIFLGMGLALLTGAVLGMLMGRFKRWNQLMDPIIYLTYPIPKLALLPMIMLLFGLGEASKLMLIFLIVFPQVVLSVRDTVKEIPEHLYDIYECLQASSWQKFKAITLPASYGAILSTSRVSLGTALSVLFFTENYGTSYGMGYFIMDAWLRLDYPMMYGAIVTLSGVGFLLFLLIDLVGTYAMRWKN